MFSAIGTGVRALRSQSCWRRSRRWWQEMAAVIFTWRMRFYRRWRRIGGLQKNEQNRAEKVKSKRKKERETLRKLFRGKDTRLSELRIVLLGWEEESDPEETDSETQRTEGDDRLCSGSRSDTSYGGEGDDTLERGFVSQEDDRETQILLSRLKDLLERELNRREVLMMIKMKQMIQECTKEGSIPHPPNMREGTPSEPDSTDIAWSCKKVYDWLRDSHSRDPVGCEMTSEVGDEEHTDCSYQHAWRRNSKELAPNLSGDAPSEAQTTVPDRSAFQSV
ncbi:hypothetical protein AGOR_G00162850 [Albula goreensis]|uniref:Uncharacterized protein n=1 Tax=Albula goreensis TaxID=1534307 RepID=A0A8T3CYZ0_9TELE|nr:hypothetical protein AGOR_G00162850 [Albula goreensis]